MLFDYVIDRFLEHESHESQGKVQETDGVLSKKIEGLDAIIISRTEAIEHSALCTECVLVLDAMDKPSVYGMYAKVIRDEKIPLPVDFGKTLTRINSGCKCDHIEADMSSRGYGLSSLMDTVEYKLYHKVPGWFEFSVDSSRPKVHKIMQINIDRPLELAQVEINLFEDICEAYITATTAD